MVRNCLISLCYLFNRDVFSFKLNFLGKNFSIVLFSHVIFILILWVPPESLCTLTALSPPCFTAKLVWHVLHLLVLLSSFISQSLNLASFSQLSLSLHQKFNLVFFLTELSFPTSFSSSFIIYCTCSLKAFPIKMILSFVFYALSQWFSNFLRCGAFKKACETLPYPG